MSPRRSERPTRAEADDPRREVDEELAFHLEEVEGELRAAGLAPAEAREEARRRFGDLGATRTYCIGQQSRRGRGRRWAVTLDDLRQDLAWAVHSLRRAPGYTTVVILVLALGIAASTVVFGLVNAYFLRPLPYADAEELVQLGLVDPRFGWDGARLSRAMVEDLHAGATTLEDVAVYYYGTVNVTGPEGPQRLQVAHVSDGMFRVLGADASRGRTFGPGEGGPAGAGVVVAGWDLWQRRWAGDPGIVGRSIVLDGTPHTVVGVMPAEFDFPFGGVELWTPLRTSVAEEGRGDTRYLPVARLTPGTTPDEARADLERVRSGLADLHPAVDGIFTGVSVTPLREALSFAWDELRLGLGAFLGAVLLVLAIVCANVAGLTLARATTREREMAVRAAVGAGRSRIVRQLLTESLLLAGAGGALGVGAAYATAGALTPLLPADLYRVGDVTVDARVLAFWVAVTLATALLSGLAPALRVTRRDLAPALRSASRGAGGGDTARTRSLLVVAEVALAVVLVTGTGLMVRSFAEVRRIDLGFEAERVLTVEVTPPESDYPGADEYGAWFDRAAGELEALPGVTDVGQVYPLPLNHEAIPLSFAVPGSEPARRTEWPSALWASVSPGYFRSMDVALLAGRTFDGSDVAGGPQAVMVSRRFAERHLPEGPAVGATLLLASGDTSVAATVVGVVEDVVHSGIRGGPSDVHVYRPLAQHPTRRRFLTLRTAGDPRAVAAATRRGLATLDPDLPAAIRPMEDVVLESTFTWSVGSLVLGVFGLVAVLLASLGVYGLVSWSVARRRREMGVRMALGARARDVRAMVLGDGLRLTATGAALGILAALALGRVLESLLFGVSPSDPWTLGAVVALFGLVALAAAVIPARRATRLDPAQVLRSE